MAFIYSNGEVVRHRGEFAIVQLHTADGVWIRYEDDRLNIPLLVPFNEIER